MPGWYWWAVGTLTAGGTTGIAFAMRAGAGHYPATRPWPRYRLGVHRQGLAVGVEGFLV
jgi:hypothetical protein